jgi:hypothetical protein
MFGIKRIILERSEKHVYKISLLSFLIGIVWIILFPQVSRKVYLSENALLSDSIYYNIDKSFINDFQNNIKNLNSFQNSKR